MTPGDPDHNERPDDRGTDPLTDPAAAELVDVESHGVPHTDMRLMSIAGVLLALPIIALMWVGSYNQEDPKLGAFPFFFWYQGLWVFLTSACTYGAFRLTLAARPGGRHRR